MDFVEISKKWQKFWKENQVYKVKEDEKNKSFYILDMFPYPSGAGLHVGHPKGYIATDVIARKHMLQGEKVLHPMGFDTFGLGTEQYAMANKMKPQVAAEQNIKTYKKQLEIFGCTYDWDREVNTADPKYFKRTQRTFLKMYNSYFDQKDQKAKSIDNLISKIDKGEVKVPENMEKEDFIDSQRLVYLDYKPINWCPSCQTGLANEDLDSDGNCERCGTSVEQKPMKQRVIRITKYSDRLLEGLENLPGWSDSARDQQKNWIGKSKGTQFELKVNSEEGIINDSIEVYTTRIDTVFGMTFVVMAPEHKLVESLKSKIDNGELIINNWDKVKKYIEKAKHKTQLERTELQKEKKGVLLDGVYAINPFNGEKVPIYIGDYVLANYGTGVVMAVPAHDERDFEFAINHKLEVVPVVDPVITSSPFAIGSTGNKELDIKVSAKESEKYTFDSFKRDPKQYKNLPDLFTEKGVLVDSGEFSSMKSEDAIIAMQKWLENKGIGGSRSNYRLQDWVFSRQRYWGEPIPMIHCDKCGIVPMDESELPLELPDVKNYEPTGTEEGPLAKIESWINIKCPKCGGNAKRESNTMPGWAGSSWYWIRYMDPKNDKELVSSQKEKFWHPVDVYVGGAEHITRHMIYARYWHKFLQDFGIVSVDEPFKKYQHVGLIMAEDGRKMSKRRGNVVNPDDIVNEFGSDVLRVYEMFIGPFDQAVNWNTNGLKGVKKFLDKLVSLRGKVESGKLDDNKVLNLLHKTIKKVGEDIDNFSFNTAISQMMILVNELSNQERISKDSFEKLVLILSPFAPHLAEEMREDLGNSDYTSDRISIFNQKLWPDYDQKYLTDDKIDLAVQINGKMRGTINVSPKEEESDILNIIKLDSRFSKYLEGDIFKVIYVKGKICNLLVK